MREMTARRSPDSYLERKTDMFKGILTLRIPFPLPRIALDTLYFQWHVKQREKEKELIKLYTMYILQKNDVRVDLYARVIPLLIAILRALLLFQQSLSYLGHVERRTINCIDF